MSNRVDDILDKLDQIMDKVDGLEKELGYVEDRLTESINEVSKAIQSMPDLSKIDDLIWEIQDGKRAKKPA